MPVTVHCSCGATSEFAERWRGQEQACTQCGRLFRIPLTDNSLHLRVSSGSLNATQLADADRLINMTSNPREALAQSKARRKARRKLLVAASLLVGALLGIIYVMTR